MKKSLLFFMILLVSLNTLAQGWEWAVGSAGSAIDVIDPGSVAVDHIGNTYTIAAATFIRESIKDTFGTITWSNYPSSGGSVLASTDSNGVPRWVLETNNQNATFFSVATDPFNNIYIIGTMTDTFTFGTKTINYSGGETAGVLIKVKSSGEVIWMKRLLADTMNILSVAMCVNSTGNLYFSSQVAPLALYKYDSSGSQIWAKPITGTDQCIALNADSEIYLAGQYDYSFYVSKYDINGNLLWTRTDSRDTIFDVGFLAVDEAGSAYLTGGYKTPRFYFGADTLQSAFDYFHDSVLSRVTFIVKYDSSGNAKWARTSPVPGDAQPVGVAADQCGHIWMQGDAWAGYFTSGIPLLSLEPVYLAEFDSAGHPEDTIVLNAGGEDGSSIVVDNKGSLYLAGDFQATCIIGNDTVSDVAAEIAGDGEQLYVAKYRYNTDPCAGQIAETQKVIKPSGNEVYLYPNPATEFLFIKTDNGACTSLAIINNLGQALIRQPITATETTINVQMLPAGVYYVILRGDNGTVVEKFVKM